MSKISKGCSKLPTTDYSRFSHRKVQIWTNDRESEFAICLSDDEPKLFRAKTNVDENQYEKLVEETLYLDGINYNWEFTLKHWINNRFKNTCQSSRTTTERPFHLQSSNTEF